MVQNIERIKREVFSMAIKETKEERKAGRERREQIWQVKNGLNLGSLADVQEFFKEMERYMDYPYQTAQ